MKSLPWYREPTRDQWCSFVAAWAGWVLDAFDFTIFLLVMPALAREFDTTLTAVAGSVTLTLLVRLAGGAAAGWAADCWGRRAVLMASMVGFAVADAAIAFAPSLAWVLALRVVFGFMMGAEWTAGTTLAMENWPARSRGIASGILQGSWAIGYLLAAAVSAVVVPAWGWRGLFLLAALPALLVLPIRWFVPESPEWKCEAQARPASARELLAPDTLRRILWASAGMMLGFGVYYALQGLYPAMLELELGLDAGSRASLVVLFNVGFLAGAVALGTLAARRGVLVAVVVPALLMLPLLPLYLGAVPSLLGLGAFLGGAVGVGWSGIVPLFLTGMFEPRIRARAVGIVYHLGACGAAFVPVLVPWLAKRLGVSLGWSMGLVAAGCELALVTVLLLQGRQPATVAQPTGAQPA